MLVALDIFHTHYDNRTLLAVTSVQVNGTLLEYSQSFAAKTALMLLRRYTL